MRKGDCVAGMRDGRIGRKPIEHPLDLEGRRYFCDVESGDVVLGISWDDGAQGSSGRLCNLNQVNQAEEPCKRYQIP